MFVRLRPRRRTPRALLCLTVLASACGGTALIPTLPTPVHATWQYFSPTISVGGTSVSTFAVSSTATIGVTLASVVAADGTPALPTLRLVLGTPAGSACTATSTKDTVPGWSAQIQAPLNSGNYCVSVIDTTNALTPSSVVTVRVAINDSAPTTSANTSTDLVTGTMLQGGSLMHEFAASFGGASAITLTGAGDGTVTLTLGAGVWDGASCRLLTRFGAIASATAQIAQAIDGGTYCLTLADPGSLAAPAAFTASIVRP
jgi:hypothetical protein